MKRLILAVCLMLLGVLPVRGQEMAVRLYVIPIDFQIVNGHPYYGPTYIKWRFNPGGLDVRAAFRYYGGMTAMILAAEVTTAQHAYLAEQSDVFAIPENIDVNPSPQELSDFEDALEALYIPANWLSPSETWREALRTILGMFAIAGKYAVAAGHDILDSGITLNMQFRNFPQVTQDVLEQIAVTRGYPWNEVKNNWTARILLKWFSDQFPAESFRFKTLITV